MATYSDQELNAAFNLAGLEAVGLGQSSKANEYRMTIGDKGGMSRLYDRHPFHIVSLAAAALTTIRGIFTDQLTGGTTVANSFDKLGQMPSGYAFKCFSISVGIEELPIDKKQASDLVQLAQLDATITVGKEPVFQGPLALLRQGHGVNIMNSHQAVAADLYFASLGTLDGKTEGFLTPFVINENQLFSMELNAPAGLTLALTAAQKVWFTMHGSMGVVVKA